MRRPMSSASARRFRKRYIRMGVLKKPRMCGKGIAMEGPRWSGIDAGSEDDG